MKKRSGGGRADVREDAVVGRRGERIATLLIGPRVIDLPIRVLLLLVAATALFPHARESDEIGYVVLHSAAAVLTVAAAFVPTATGIAAIALFVLFQALYPEYLNMFQEPVEYAAAVLLSRLQWVRSLLLLAGVFLLVWLQHRFAPDVATPYLILVFSAAVNSLLALAGAALEARVRRETERREAAARLHERQRVRFAVDAHDTVSHRLATQGALIKLLAVTPDPGASRELLAEMSLVNAETQRELYEFLAQLGTVAPEHGGEQGDRYSDLHRLLENLRQAAELGGLHLDVDSDVTAVGLQDVPFGEVGLMLRELVTNMVKHAVPGSACSLAVREDSAVPGGLMIESRNAASREGTSEVSRSISLRAEDIGGSGEAALVDGEYRVIVRIPTALPETAIPS